ncbi:MAG: hypothetical protein GWP15_03275 [Nitrospirae bacterium]|nr:hypothetical protein [Nitrospirota bacterium]
MKKRVSILVAVMLVAFTVLTGLFFLQGGSLGVNVFGVNETLDEGSVDIVDSVNDDYEISLKKLLYDGLEDNTLKFRVKFPEDKESVLTFTVTNEDGDVVNSGRYSNIHIRVGQTSPSDIVLPIEWSEPGTYHINMEIVDRMTGAVVYEDGANLYYK